MESGTGVFFVIEDADNLSCLDHEAPVIVWEEGALTEEVVGVRATSLLAQVADLVLTGLSGAGLNITSDTRTGTTEIIANRCTEDRGVI